MARDITALGSFAVLSIVVFAVVIYLLMAHRRVAAFWILAAVCGGVILSSLLKMAYERPRPDLVTPERASSLQTFRAGMPPFRRSLI